MSSSEPKTWRQVILDRFSDRPDIGIEGVKTQYWPSVPDEAMTTLFELLEAESGVSPGLLRPTDPVLKLFNRPETRNPFKWLVFETRSDDRKSEINYRLRQRMEKFGTIDKWASIETIDDLVKAWSGQLPSGRVDG